MTPLPRLLCAVLAALLLTACARQPPPRDAIDAMTGKGPQSSARDVLILATPSQLLDAGREAFADGHYAVAATRFEAVLKKSPGHGLATAYLGLCRWFSGKPAETAALWDGLPKNDAPKFSAELRSCGTGLGLLADRLRARDYKTAALRGRSQPLAEGLVVAAPPTFVSASDADWLPVPPAARALHLLLLDALAGFDTPRILPRGLTAALVAETLPAAADGATPDQARALAQLVGAEYAVACSIRPAPGERNTLRTSIAVLPTEDAAARRIRLAAVAEDTSRRLTEARQALTQLDTDLTLTAFGLQYFRTRDAITERIAERTAVERQILDLNASGSLKAAQIAVARLDRIESAIADLQQELRRQEQATVGLAAHIFAYNASTLAKRDEQLRKARVDMERRHAELTQQADIAFARAARLWPTDGITREFDLPAARLLEWPDRAAQAVADILGGRRRHGVLPQAFSSDATTEHLIALDRALHAWDNGEYAAAERLLRQAAPVPPRMAPPPPPWFDVLAQVAMRPDDIAALYAERLETAAEADRAPARRPSMTKAAQ